MNDFGARAGAALVLGASGGLGRAIARMLLDRGSAVAMTYHRGAERLDPLRAHAADLGRAASVRQLDLTDTAGTASAVTRAAAEHSGIHTLVYAAGPHVPMVHLSRVAPDELARQLLTDTAGFFAAVTAALPYLRACGGSVVAVTSAATARYPVRDGLSATPKAAVEAIVRGIAAEEGPFGVRANCVGPGMTTDGMAERLIGAGDLDARALEIARRNIPLRRFGDAADIAEAVCFLASDRAGFISGQKLDVDGGYGV